MKKLFGITTLLLIAFAVISASCTPKAPKVTLKTGLDSLSYALGINYTQGLDNYLKQMGISEEYRSDFVQGLLEGSKIKKEDLKAQAKIMGLSIGREISATMVPQANSQTFGSDSTQTVNVDRFLAGFIAGATKENLLIEETNAGVVVQTEVQKIKSKLNEKFKVENAEFLEKNKTEEGVVVLPSGLQYKVVKEGTGEKPTAESTVEVDYVGKNIHGKEFDRGEHTKLPLNGVIAGWTEGIQLMPVGSKYIFYIPYNLAYGEDGRPGAIDPYATLVFEVDLYSIEKPATEKK